MKTIALMPGSFDPPTYGHYHLLKKAHEIFDKVIIVCSENDSKAQRWFSVLDSMRFWYNYDLPKNVEVMDLPETIGVIANNNNVVMIRGIRGESDFEHELEVMTLNHNAYKIDKYFHIFSDEEYKDISSTDSKTKAKDINLEALSKCVSPLVLTSLIERACGFKSVFMVVGKPGTGKTTFLRMLEQLNPHNVHINTDHINRQMKQLLEREFGEGTLLGLAVQDDKNLLDVARPLWLKRLEIMLRHTPIDSNVFIEVPYGLQPSKEIYKYIGGKIICIGCKPDEQKKRLESRGGGNGVAFSDKIPDMEESRNICIENNLSFCPIASSGSIERLQFEAEVVNHSLNGEKNE